jgi:zinc/manganese transport system ATP-binding protein
LSAEVSSSELSSGLSTALEVSGGRLELGGRVIWSELTFAMAAGQFVAVLGANGAGKSSLLKVLMGLLPLSSGRAEVLGRAPRRGRREVGHLPQHRSYTLDAPLRARDLVRFGVDGHRFGLGGSKQAGARVDELLEAVGAAPFANQRLGRLSGGEQQRLRIAQALAAQPEVMLCDEPLQSLDLGYQQLVVDLIDSYRVRTGGSVVFVTHDINPVIDVVDRVLYLFEGRYQWGTVEDVMTTEALSELYRSRVDVMHHDGRLMVLGGHGSGGHSI